ncbi:alpha/beta hydrolase fold domain-containing protein [Akkermansiaceae bacterium]|nr:alpha/beta hydrolase fold domain-containing protein [Akkermansiaceae bacterium]
MKLTFALLACLLMPLGAAQETRDIVMSVNGIEIPILIITPSSGKGPFPVVYNVHGGGWNGGTETVVPPASVPPEAKFLSDELGIVYVGLAYRCKVQKGTFKLAMEDLRASIQWFEARAATYKADTSLIAFTGGSAGTPLSAMLAQEMPSCAAYVGLFGVYDFTNNKESLFPDEKACSLFGLSSPEQKLASSAFHHIRKNPPATLLFHGGKDILTHSSQSIRFAEKLRGQGGQAEAVIFPEMNHGYFNPRYPAEYKATTLKIAGLYAENLKLEKSKVDALPAKLDRILSPFFPVDEIKPAAIAGQWKGETDTLAFQAGGAGTRTDPKNTSRPFTYKISGNTILVDFGKTKETYYMQRDLRVIYKFHPEGRFAGNKQWYQKQK